MGDIIKAHRNHYVIKASIVMTCPSISSILLELAKECSSRPSFQYRALFILSNKFITAHENHHSAQIIKYNGHETLINILISSPYYQIQESAMWTLNNIMAHDLEVVRVLITRGIFDIIRLKVNTKYNSTAAIDFEIADKFTINRDPVQIQSDLLCVTAWNLSNIARLTCESQQIFQQCLNSIWMFVKIILGSTTNKKAPKLQSEIGAALAHLSIDCSIKCQKQRFITKFMEQKGRIQDLMRLLQIENCHLRE